MPGQGKSALAWYWMKTEVVARGLADGIFWWSFDPTRNFTAFLRCGFAYLCASESDPGTDARRVEALLHTATKCHALVVLNDFHTQLDSQGMCRNPHTYNFVINFANSLGITSRLLILS
jgi:hypothetical protein